MSSEAEIRRLLERVAVEIANHPKMIEWNVRRAAYEVLERRLLPLLLAGQAMRDCNYINTSNSMAWDAALELNRTAFNPTYNFTFEIKKESSSDER